MLTCLFLLGGLCPAAFSAVLDQAYDLAGLLTPQGNCDGCSVGSIGTNEALAQTFTAGISGKLDGVDLFIGSGTGTNSLLVDIYITAGGLPVDNPSGLLGRVVLPASAIPTIYPGLWTQVDFSANEVYLQVASQYAIRIAMQGNENNSIVAWWGKAPGPYPRRQAICQAVHRELSRAGMVRSIRLCRKR